MTNSEVVSLLMHSQYYKQGYKQGGSDVLDKIRAEIEQLPTTECTETHRIYIDVDDFKKNVLVILDKYKAESEVGNEAKI